MSDLPGIELKAIDHNLKLLPCKAPRSTRQNSVVTRVSAHLLNQRRSLVGIPTKVSAYSD